jgi:hypothetical protein
MCVCMYVCTCMCVCTCMYVHLYIYIYMYVYMCVCIYVLVRYVQVNDATMEISHNKVCTGPCNNKTCDHKVHRIGQRKVKQKTSIAPSMKKAILAGFKPQVDENFAKSWEEHCKKNDLNRYVCMYVHIYVCVYACYSCVQVYIYMCVCMYVHVFMYMYVCIQSITSWSSSS